MRIAMNITREYMGGITSSNLNLMDYLCGKNHEFVGIELNGNEYMKGPTIFKDLPLSKFDHHIINIFELPIYEILKRPTTQKLSDIEKYYKDKIKLVRKVLKETKPDVVLLNGTYFLPWIVALAAKKENIPIVLRYAGVLSLETTHFKPRQHALMKAMERSIVKSASHIIFPSEICKNVVENEVIKKILKHTFVIPNPVSPLFTDKNAFELSVERRIAAVGRYTQIKNFQAFFQLHKILKKDKWRHTASFVTNTAREKIAGLPKSIEVLPSMNTEGIKKFYLTQGLIVCPSHFETFGNVPMEAACLGIPVLVNETMGCADILKKAGLANMVISFEDVDAVTERIKSLCGQYILPKQLNTLKKLLDYRFIGEEVLAVLESAATRNY